MELIMFQNNFKKSEYCILNTLIDIRCHKRLTGVDKLAKPTFRSRYVHTPFG